MKFQLTWKTLLIHEDQDLEASGSSLLKAKFMQMKKSVEYKLKKKIKNTVKTTIPQSYFSLVF